MRLLDILGQRWVLRLLWELRGGPLNFRAVQAACDGISPAVLNDRLKLLRAHDLVVLQAGGYALSPRAAALQPIILQMMDLANDWAAAGSWPQPPD